MEFRNPKVPEGINVSRHSPLTDLALLSGGLLAALMLLTVALIYLGGALFRYVPLSWEAALARHVLAEIDSQAAGDPAVRDALQDLAGRLSERMGLPDGMTVTVHYLDSDQVNAMATLGGHVFVFRGLIERLPNENALAMVLAHEIAHVANRDPAASAGSGLMLQLAYSLVLGNAPGAMTTMLGRPNALLLLGFGRQAETRADAEALGAVAALYGHVAGASKLFEIFLEMAAESGRDEPPQVLSSHPISQGRIAALKARALAEDWPLEGTLTPLPPVLAAIPGEDTLGAGK